MQSLIQTRETINTLQLTNLGSKHYFLFIFFANNWLFPRSSEKVNSGAHKKKRTKEKQTHFHVVKYFYAFRLSMPGQRRKKVSFTARQ